MVNNKVVFFGQSTQREMGWLPTVHIYERLTVFTLMETCQGLELFFEKCAYVAAERVGEHPENEIGQTSMIAWIRMTFWQVPPGRSSWAQGC